MSDVAALLSAFSFGDLVAPGPEQPSLVDVSRAVATLAGVEDVRQTPYSRSIASTIGPTEHLVFVLADGFGMTGVEHLGPNAFLRRHVAMTVSSVFPTTTPTVLTTLATGEWPGQHGVVGWDMYLDEVDTVAAIIRFHRRYDEKPLTELRMPIESAFPVPSLMKRVPRDVLFLTPKEIAGTVFSDYSGGNRPYAPYEKLPSAVNTVIAHVRAAERPTLTHVYWPNVDGACHHYGAQSPQARESVLELDREVERLAKELAGTARIVVTADHGLLDADRHDEVYRLWPNDRLIGKLKREPWGNSRIMYFDARDATAFERVFRDRFGEHAYLVSTEDAIAMGLFGPDGVSETTRRRLGSHVSISKGRQVIAYMAPTTKEQRPLNLAHHSGLTPAEMLVPLVVA